MDFSSVRRLSVRKVSAFVFSVFMAFAAEQRSASAIDLSANGTMIILSGPIRAGDEFEFEHFISAHAPGTFKSIRLSSPGGFLLPAIEIGRTIRANNLATLVDASKDNCASACTMLFASGVQRHYVNADKIQDGELPRGGFGLGFHQGSTALSLEAGHQSGRASAIMISAFYEFGTPGAAHLVEKAPSVHIYRVSGQTALSSGIATSLAPL